MDGKVKRYGPGHRHGECRWPGFFTTRPPGKGLPALPVILGGHNTVPQNLITISVKVHTESRKMRTPFLLFTSRDSICVQTYYSTFYTIPSMRSSSNLIKSLRVGA